VTSRGDSDGCDGLGERDDIVMCSRSPATSDRAQRGVTARSHPRCSLITFASSAASRCSGSGAAAPAHVADPEGHRWEIARLPGFSPPVQPLLDRRSAGQDPLPALAHAPAAERGRLGTPPPVRGAAGRIHRVLA